MFKQSGISVTAFGLAPVPRTIAIEPITSKSVIGRAAIEIPQEQLGEVIKALFKELPENTKTNFATELLESK